MNRRGAYTLPELLVTVGLLTVFALAAGRLFHATMRVGQSTSDAQNAAASFDAALAVLRADAWSAGEVAVANPASARLGSVTWTIKDGAISREAAEGGDGDGASPRPPRRWDVPRGLTFAADGPAVVVRVPATPGAPGGDIRLVSQVQLLSRLSP